MATRIGRSQSIVCNNHFSFITVRPQFIPTSPTSVPFPDNRCVCKPLNANTPLQGLTGSSQIMGGNTKTTNSLRRGSSSLSKVSTPPATLRSGKGSKPSLTVKLSLSSSILSRFPHDKPPRKPLPSKPTAAPPPPNPTQNEKVKVLAAKPELKPRPPPNQAEVPERPADQVPSKGSSTPKAGAKRELGEGVDDNGKSKARPGPKKKQKL